MDMRPTEDFWKYLGIGIMLLLILVGMGTCALLGNITSFSFPAT